MLSTRLGHKSGMNRLNSEGNHFTVFFRYDDLSATSPFDIEKQVVDVFQSVGCAFTIGIIPFITKGAIHDPGKYGNEELPYEKVSLLRHAILSGIVDPALHGYEHKNSHVGRPFTEFKGLIFDAQYEKLLSAATLFEQQLDIRPSIFIPPWNTYDHITLEILDMLKIPNISANIYGITNSSTLKFLPVAGGPEIFSLALEEAQNLNCKNILIGFLLHSYDFHESGDNRSSISFRSLYEFLEKIKGFPDTQILSVGQILQLPYLFNGYRCQINKPPVFKCLRPPYIKRYSYLTYLPAEKALGKKLHLLFHIILFYAFIIAICTCSADVLFASIHYRFDILYVTGISIFGTTLALLMNYMRGK